MFLGYSGRVLGKNKKLHKKMIKPLSVTGKSSPDGSNSWTVVSAQALILPTQALLEDNRSHFWSDSAAVTVPLAELRLQCYLRHGLYNMPYLFP